MKAEPSPADRATRIVIIDPSPVRRAILEEGLAAAGYRDIVHPEGIERVMERIVALDPDLIVIDLESPTRDVLEQMFQVSRAVPRPVAMFIDRSDTAMIQAAINPRLRYDPGRVTSRADRGRAARGPLPLVGDGALSLAVNRLRRSRGGVRSRRSA
jgi:response regulator NasT